MPAAGPAPAALEPTGKYADRTRRHHAIVHELLVEGRGLREITRHLGWGLHTVQRYARAATWQELAAGRWQGPRASKLDPFKPYLDQRTGEGCGNGAQLFREITARGYAGSYPVVRAYLERHRPTRIPLQAAPPTVRDVTGWITRHPDSLTEDDRPRLKAVLERCPELQAASDQVRAFAVMMAQLSGQDLPQWISDAKASALPGLSSFARCPDAPASRCYASASCSPPRASQRPGGAFMRDGRAWHYDPVAAVPELHGDRIVLNAHSDEDAAAHVAGEDEETARRFGWWPEHSTEETVRATYADWAKNWHDNGPTRTFAARDPESGALVGGCELRIHPDGTGDVSYWTHAGKRGQGHAQNALTLLAGYAASIGVTCLEAHIAPDNHASQRVAEAAGFTQAGTVVDDGTEMIRYIRQAFR